MPKSADYTLSWSPPNQAYELYKGQRGDTLDLVPGNPAWLV